MKLWQKGLQLMLADIIVTESRMLFSGSRREDLNSVLVHKICFVSPNGEYSSEQLTCC